MGRLFVIATPIGNLEDLSPRGQRLLGEADIIAAEDTRVTGSLLKAFGIDRKELVSYHDHNEAVRAEALIQRLVDDDLTLCLVSDAGTPAIADPGYRLVSLAHAKGIPVHPVPGPSAASALVSVSGLPSDRVLFVGFLPTKEAALKREAASWAGLGASVVFFESTRRLATSLTRLAALLPGARIAIGRELTKMHEEVANLPIEEGADWCRAHATLKGEAVVMVAPAPDEGEALTEEEIRALVRQELASGATVKDVVERLHGTGMNRKELYRLVLSEVSSS